MDTFSIGLKIGHSLKKLKFLYPDMKIKELNLCPYSANNLKCC